MGHISLLSKSCNYHSSLENVTGWPTSVPELLWVTTEAGQMAATLQEAPECSVRLVSVTLSKIKTKPSADGSSPHANIFVCLEWKTLGGKRGYWMPGVCGRDFNHVQSLEKIWTDHSKEGLSLKGKSVSPDLNSRHMSSSPVSSISSSDFVQSKRDWGQGIWPDRRVTPGEAQEKEPRPSHAEYTWGTNDSL